MLLDCVMLAYVHIIIIYIIYIYSPGGRVTNGRTVLRRK